MVKKILAFYFRSYISLSQIYMLTYIILCMITAVVGFVGDKIPLAIFSLVVSLFSLPYIFILFGLIKRNGLESMPIDLSTYEFGNKDFEKDFHTDSIEGPLLTEMFNKKRLESDKKASLLKMVRDIAIENNLSPRQYLIVIALALVTVGSNSSGEEKEETPKAPLKEDILKKLEKIKSNLEKRPAEPEKPKGKYDFL